MNQTPKISVIIPVYNSELYLRDCLDSVINQTMREIEIICVNDGSTDSSKDILEEYAAKDSRVVVIHQQNSKQGAARNRGIDIAKGEYIQFVDSDDWIELNACEFLYDIATTNQNDVTVFNLDEVWKNNYTVPRSYSRLDINSINDKLSVFCYDNGCGPTKYLIKKSLLNQSPCLRFHEKMYLEDIPFSTHLAFIAQKVTVTEKVLYHYRISNSSTIGNGSVNFDKYANMAYSLLYQDTSNFSEFDSAFEGLTRWKLEILFFGCSNIPFSRQRAFANQMRKNRWFGEYQIAKDIILPTLNPFYRQLFIFIYGRFTQRFIANCKMVKYRFADWLAKKLVPHSLWLQNLTQFQDKSSEEGKQKWK